MAEHALKTWPRSFRAIKDGSKSLEFRRDDRGYAAGDVLHLREWDPQRAEYTGDELRVVVSDIEREAGFGIPEGFVAMSVKPHGAMLVAAPTVGGRPWIFACASSPNGALFGKIECDGENIGPDVRMPSGSTAALAHFLEERARDDVRNLLRNRERQLMAQESDLALALQGIHGQRGS
jgi:hypothetical protein